MLEPDFAAAVAPLLEEDRVDALEWSFDMGWANELPAWATLLLDHYSVADTLYGHGVSFSPLSARWEARQDRWIARFAEECGRRRYRHVSEHFGFMTAGRFDHGAPLPVPFTEGALAVGRDRIARMRAASGGLSIGLENLALAFAKGEARAQGRFLEELVAPSNGFVVLDLHNVHCQAVNFGLPIDALLATFPADRVRELHLSGGSWSSPRADEEHRPFRRDTHDGPVPEEVVDVLPRALARFPNVEVVIVERLGGTLAREADAARFRDDYRRIHAIAHGIHDV